MFRKRDIEIDNRNQCFKDLLCSLQEPMLIQWQPPKWHLEPTNISALEVEQALQILQVLLRVIVNISQDITKVQEVVEAIVTIIITINLSTQFIGFAKVSGCQTTPLWGGQWPIGKTTSTPFGLLGTDVFFFSDTWRCIFILDPWFAGSSNQGVNKWRFLLQCLEDLDQSLRKLNSRLYVVRGQPADALPNLFKQWNTTYLSFEEDPEPYGRVRDQNIMAMCKEMGIKVVTEKSHTLYDLNKYTFWTTFIISKLTYLQFLIIGWLKLMTAKHLRLIANSSTSSHLWNPQPLPSPTSVLKSKIAVSHPSPKIMMITGVYQPWQNWDSIWIVSPPPSGMGVKQKLWTG